MNVWKMMIVILLVSVAPLMAASTGGHVIELHASNFDQIINGAKPAVVDMYADWCGPCKAMAPNFKQAAAVLGDRCIFAKVNIDNSSLGSRFSVYSIPTLIFFKNGKEVARAIGYKSEAEIISLTQIYCSISAVQ